MRILRAMRTLIVMLILASSPTLLAGDLRNLPDVWRAYFIHRLIATYALKEFSDYFLYYFGSSDIAPTQATREMDDLWLTESQNYAFYEPVLITTSDLRRFTFSHEEFIELQKQLQLYFPNIADAILHTTNQYNITLAISSSQLDLLLSMMKRDHPDELIAITTSDRAELYFSPHEVIRLSTLSSVLTDQMVLFPILDHIHLEVSSSLLNLLQLMMRAQLEGLPAIFDTYSHYDLETIQTEAEIIKCGYLKTKIKRFLANTRRSTSIRLPEYPKMPDLRASDAALARTRKGRAQTMAQIAIPSTEISACSLPSPRVNSARTHQNLTQEGKKQLRRATTSLIIPRRKAQPLTPESTTAASSTATVEITAALSPLEKAVEWSLVEKFQPVVGYYYSYIATDAELAVFLKNLDLEKEKNRTFAFALIRGYIEEGFPHKLEQTLIDEIYNLIYRLHDKVAGGTVILGTEFAAEDTKAEEGIKLKKKFENGAAHAEQKHWLNYENGEIAHAWTFSDTLTFCNLPPLLSLDSYKPDMKNKLSAMAIAQNVRIDWLVNEIKQSKDKKAKKALLSRLCDIAKIMLDIGNFNGAITIYGALQKEDFLTPVKNDAEKLEQLFASPKNYHDVISLFRELKSSRIGAAVFYGSIFETRTSGISRAMETLKEEGDAKEIAEYELEAAILIGQFLREMRLDQRSATYSCDVHPDLVAFFMNTTKS